MKTNKYKFKQSELYTIARLILSALTQSEILARFAAFKGKYTAPWVADRLVQVEEAENEPDKDARSATHEIARSQLVVLLNSALLSFRALERYIIEVIPLAEQQPSIDAAGGTKYTDAAEEDFDAGKQMLNSAITYVTNNETVLLNGGLNMPAGFKAGLETLRTNYQAKHNQFLGAEVTAEIETEDKIELNNNVYEQIITSINSDAQVIYSGENEQAIRQQFVLEHQLQLVRGAGVAGMRFHVTDSATTLDVEAANILIKPSTELTTNNRGRALKLQLAAATYQVVISKTGYVPQELTLIVETGKVKRVDVQLQPV